MGEDAQRDFVVEVGEKLKRPREEVEPYAQILVENWYDNPESLADAKPEELATLGIPLRFAKALVAQASGGDEVGTTQEKSKGKSRGEKGKGKGKDSRGGKKGNDSERSRRYEDREDDGLFRQVIALEPCDPSFNLRGSLIGEKGQYVHHIQDQTGAKVWLTGNHGETMHCEISAASPRDLNRAARMAKDLIATVYTQYDRWLGEQERGKSPAPATAPSKGDRKGGRREGKGKEGGKGKRRGAEKGADGSDEGEFHHEVMLEEVDAGFPLRGKLVGPSGHNVHHIQDQTGAKLWFTGGPGEPVRMEVTAKTQEALDEAAALADDLITHIYEEYRQWRKDGSRPERPEKGGGKGGKGKKRPLEREREPEESEQRTPRRESEAGGGGGKGGGGGEFKKALRLKVVEPGFRVKGALIGDHGRNMHHIQDRTGAKLWIDGEPRDGMRLEISADSREDLEQAASMARDLIRTVYREYDSWLREQGKGARDRDNDEEPPSKRQRSGN